VSTVSKIGTDFSEDRNASNFRAKQYKKSSVLCREFEDNTETSVTMAEMVPRIPSCHYMLLM